MNRSTMIIAALAAAVATTGTVAFPAYAAETPKALSVGYGDLNLASSQGAATLKKRVVRAAKNVCASRGDRSLKEAMDARDCTKLSLAKAMPQVELALANAGGTQLAENARISVAAH